VTAITPVLRAAEDPDAVDIAALINRAYEVERFFVSGDRTNADEIRRLTTAGTFLVLHDEGGDLLATVYTTVRDGRGYFGMLAVAPEAQGRGLGRRLIAEAERRARLAGARWMDISVVNLREDLLRFYERLGYRPTGTAPYVHRPVIQPCHFVTMSRRLD
jgi:GNAT superfamily N-acetyltransferase